MAQLSDRYIKALKAQDKPYIITEESAERGGGRFQVKVYTSGRKQFLIQYFHNKRRRQMGIGNYGAMTLADARQEFIRLSASASASAQQGICPKTERQLMSTTHCLRIYLSWDSKERTRPSSTVEVRLIRNPVAHLR